MNHNWPRWLRASSAQWFKAKILPTLPFFLEGGDRRTEELREYVEFRLDGPYAKELNKGFWQLDVEINVLVVTSRDDSDVYEHDRNVGSACAAFTKGVPIWKLGDGEDDDPLELLGCMVLIPLDKERIIVSNFGQIAPDTRMMQSTVEAHYRLQLKT